MPMISFSLIRYRDLLGDGRNLFPTPNFSTEGNRFPRTKLDFKPIRQLDESLDPERKEDYILVSRGGRHCFDSTPCFNCHHRLGPCRLERIIIYTPTTYIDPKQDQSRQTKTPRCLPLIALPPPTTSQRPWMFLLFCLQQ